MSEITPDLVRHLGVLARIQLSDEEVERLTGQLDVIVDNIAKVSQVATSDVPVQGCAVLAEEKIVVTQPAEGEFKAFSAACTHQGCLVSSSKDGVIPCTCHGSEFSLADGAVLKGPAEAALTEVPVEVRDGVVTATER